MRKLHVQEHHNLMKQMNDLYQRKIINIEEFRTIMKILNKKLTLRR